jgi:hypothetical protein
LSRTKNQPVAGSALVTKLTANMPLAPLQIAKTNLTSHQALPGRAALLLGAAIFLVPNDADIPALADALLLAPGARWQDWFTRGYSHFWDLYPEWPVQDTGFTRPAFQLVIYLTHFALGRDWASYQVIGCFAVAGMGAVAFYIAQTILGLRFGSSLLAAMLVVLSPPVLKSWLLGLAFAIEPLGTLLVAGAFLAILARRDFLCLALLFLALMTKENTVWAPLAAAITVMSRPKPDESLRRRAFAAAGMFLPVVTWLALRLAFFSGIGGTHATAQYSPVGDFLNLTFDKLTHLHYLFLTHGTYPNLLDRGTGLLVYVLLLLWALHIFPATLNCFRFAMQERRWPAVDVVFLVALWATIALTFHFALPLSKERYATSVVMFAWPALVAEVERCRKVPAWFVLALCCIVSLTRSSHGYIEWIANVSTANPSVRNDKLMGSKLREVPASIRQIYILSAGGLAANPEHVRLVLGVSAEVVRVADIIWNCEKTNDLVAFDQSTADGAVNLTVRLPACAYFSFFSTNSFNGPTVANGRIYRNDTMSYEVPEAYSLRHTRYWEPAFYLGRTMTVHVRLNGPARFIIEHGGPEGIAWFDTPGR